MSDFYVNVLQIRDTSFQIGVLTGRRVRNTSIVKTWKALTKPIIDHDNMKSIYETLAPHLLEELDGLAYELEISPKKATALFSGYDVPKPKAIGCSALITRNHYVRNYDFSPEVYDGLLSLVQPKEALASVGYNLQILGRHDGVNQEGLVMGLHFVSHEDYRKGVSPWITTRMVLDTCSSLDEAVSLIKEIPHAACYNFSIGDREGNIAIVEASPEQVVVRNDEALSCVNHFQTNLLKSKNRKNIEGSVKRNNYLQSLSDRYLTQNELFNHFKSKNSPVFFTDYDDYFGTLHTFSYSFPNTRILTTIAQSNQILDMDLQRWLDGEDINMKVLKGSIEKD
ncbi:peptidase C45 [Pontibacillus yanchengensis]|uniref:Peptidase C45 n=1 Tax=Pontibacillus yanchengensis TaxID=462910 RepID=A0A6I4ZYQ8_9BACI|nr:C45 family peptidase [Pontibacillus yanchengensis]MYL32943.1 peptidase C45 [Pontibacillus yanchengensis]